MKLQYRWLRSDYFKDKDQVCDNAQSIAIFKSALVRQDDDKTAVRWSQFAITLQFIVVKLQSVANLLPTTKLLSQSPIAKRCVTDELPTCWQPAWLQALRVRLQMFGERLH